MTFPQRNWLFLFISFITLIPCARASFRQDLKLTFNKLICQEGTDNPNYKNLWKEGIFDAGLITYIIEVKGQNPTKTIKTELKKLLKAERHRGYAWGHCRQHRYWIATTPSPTPLVKKSLNFIINQSQLASHCSSFRIDFGGAEYGFPRKLFSSKLLSSQPKKEITINPSLLGEGTITVTCSPKSKQIGSQMWFMLPSKDGPLQRPIMHELLTGKSGSLTGWINAIRREHELEPLNSHNQKIQEASTILLDRNTSITHLKPHLKEMRNSLSKLGGRFLGENRVHSASDEESAWLLWNSPRHRYLLLLRKANSINILKKPTRSSQLSVLVFSRI